MIIRILNKSYALSISDKSLSDFDKFMKLFGESACNEMMADIYQKMHENTGEEDAVNQYKISINVEKCRRFKIFKGEFIE